MKILVRSKTIDPTKPPTLIPVGDLHWAIVDADDADWISQYKWVAIRPKRTWYARTNASRNGKNWPRLMHRMIAGTRADDICHHRDRNGLNNRRSNLRSITQQAHQFLHRNDTLLVKFEENHGSIPDSRFLNLAEEGPNTGL